MMIRQMKIGISTITVHIIWSTAALVFFGAMKRAIQCGETEAPIALAMKIAIRAPQPKLPSGVSMIPAFIGGPPTFTGAVVTATASRILPIPPVAVNTAHKPKAKPTRIKMALTVSVAATDQKPPVQVMIRNTRKPKIAHS